MKKGPFWEAPVARRVSLLVGLVVFACGGGLGPGGVASDEATFEADVAQEALEVAHGEDIGGDDFVAGHEDVLTPKDEAIVDLQGPDEGVVLVDEVTSDLGLTDETPKDPGPKDSFIPYDEGPKYSENVEACIYVVEGLCDKFIKRCDDMALNLVPDQWLLACADFLAKQEALIVTACLQLDNVNTNDPTVQLILSFGPTALRQCADNFECNFKTLGVIADFIMPLLEGKKVEATDILTLVANLCFK